MANGQLWEIDSQGNKKVISGLIPVTEADEINFDNSNTDLQSTDVQGAIEELTSAENIAYDSNNSVKDMIDGNLFKTDSISTGSFSVNALSYADKNTAIPSKAGYVPIGVISWALNTALGSLVKTDITQTSGTYYLNITIGNPTANAINPNPTFKILYMKS